MLLYSGYCITEYFRGDNKFARYLSIYAMENQTHCKKVWMLEKYLTDKRDLSVCKLLSLRGSLKSDCTGNCYKYVGFIHNLISR